MKCKNCGNILSDDSISCFLCGSTDLVKIKNQEELPSLIMNNEELVLENNNISANVINKKSNLFIIISLILISLFMFFSIFSIVLGKKLNNGVSYSEFIKYMEDNDYIVNNLSGKNNIENYYSANNDDYSLMYIYSYEKDKTDKYYNSVRNSILGDNNKYVTDIIDVSIDDFSKYSVTYNGKYKIVVKNNNTILFANTSVKYIDEINDIFNELGYSHEFLVISFVLLLLSIFIFFILFIVSLWKIFVKTGRSGFISLVPIYNLYCFTKITIASAWLFIILFIPVVNVIFWMYLCYKLSILFGKNNLYSLLSALLWIYFIPRIAFDDSIYLGIRKN